MVYDIVQDKEMLQIIANVRRIQIIENLDNYTSR